ncbi:hypothetical protein [Streptomyces noursei]|uniref:hypothetical protein n=1 Tax=Streptomyces noursei TaxID=1971 RepID=UPI0030F44A9B
MPDPGKMSSAARQHPEVPERSASSQNGPKVSVYRSNVHPRDFEQGKIEYATEARKALERAADFVELYDLLQEWADFPTPEQLSKLCGYPSAVLEKVANEPFYGLPTAMRKAREVAVSITLSVIDQPGNFVLTIANDCRDAAKAAEEAHKVALMARKAWTEGRTEAVWIGRA